MPAFQSDALSPLWWERVDVGLFGAIEGRAHLGEKIALLSCKGCRNFEGIALFKGQGNGERPWCFFLFFFSPAPLGCVPMSRSIYGTSVFRLLRKTVIRDNISDRSVSIELVRELGSREFCTDAGRYCEAEQALG